MDRLEEDFRAAVDQKNLIISLEPGADHTDIKKKFEDEVAAKVKEATETALQYIKDHGGSAAPTGGGGVSRGSGATKREAVRLPKFKGG